MFHCGSITVRLFNHVTVITLHYISGIMLWACGMQTKLVCVFVCV